MFQISIFHLYNRLTVITNYVSFVLFIARDVNLNYSGYFPLRISYLSGKN